MTFIGQKIPSALVELFTSISMSIRSILHGRTPDTGLITKTTNGALGPPKRTAADRASVEAHQRSSV